MIKNKEFRSEHLLIKEIDNNDLETLRLLLMNKEIKKTFMVPDYKSIEEERQLARKVIELSSRTDRFTYGIYLKDKLIGLLDDTEINGSEIELGYVIDPSYKGKGYATEVLKKAIKELFKIGYTKVLAGAFSDNIASQRVMIKSGMKKIDTEEEIEYQGKMHKVVYYAIYPEEYKI